MLVLARTIPGSIILVLGVFFLLNNLDVIDIRFDVVWPLILIVIGLILIVGRIKR